MPDFVIGLTYDGAGFHGWQRQPALPTIQGALEDALNRVANTPTHIRVAGRTDAGVHATGQVAAFSSDAPRNLNDWLRGLNALTPDGIAVNWVVPAVEGFHPRYSATARRYIYVYHDNGRIHPLLTKRVWGCQPLDADAMHRAAQILIGEHDFSSFRAAGCQSLSPMRRVNRLTVARQGEFVVLDIEASAFVLHMVRNIAAGLFAIGSGQNQMPLEELMALRDRTLLGPTAPPEGLYLADVSYPELNFPQPATIPFITQR